MLMCVIRSGFCCSFCCYAASLQPNEEAEGLKCDVCMSLRRFSSCSGCHSGSGILSLSSVNHSRRVYPLNLCTLAGKTGASSASHPLRLFSSSSLLDSRPLTPSPGLRALGSALRPPSILLATGRPVNFGSPPRLGDRPCAPTSQEKRTQARKLPMFTNQAPGRLTAADKRFQTIIRSVWDIL